MNKKYVVRLSDDERGVCQEIRKHLKGSSQKFRRAQILLKANADGPGWPDVRIAAAFNCREQTIENLRKRLVTEGFEWALEGKRRREPPTPCKLDGAAEAKLIAMRLGKPPVGYGHWTLPLLADELVTLAIVDAISHETVRKVRKKRRIGKSNGIFAPVSAGAPRRRPHRLDSASPLGPAACACWSARWSGSGGVSRVPRGREPWNGWQAGREDGTRACTGAQVCKRPSRRARRRQDHAGVGLVEHEYL